MQPQFSTRLRRLRPKIPNDIRRLRIRLALTQRQTARRCRVRLSTYTSWELGMAWPTKQRLLDLAIALCTTVEGLYPAQYFDRKRELELTPERP